MRHQGTPALARLAAIASAVALIVTSCGIVEEVAEEEPPPPATPSERSEPPSATPEPVEDVLSQQGVSAGHPLAVEAGERVLDAGGNAVDAAIAAAFAVSVVEPFASGVGGGGSVIIAGPEGEPVFYDYREVVNNNGNIPESGSGIPGFVAGMGQLHEDYGSVEWSELLEPAHDLAAQGFPLSEFLALRMTQDDGLAAISELEHYAPGGEPLSQGQDLVQTELADTLATLSDQGWEDVYTGSLAGSLTEQVEGIDAESLADYEVVVAEPARGAFGDFEVLGAAPSLPGPAMIQMLQIAEAHGVEQMDPMSAEYINALSEAWLVAEDTVFTDLGDPAFVQVPVDEITDPEGNARLDISAQGSVMGSASPGDDPVEDAGVDSLNENARGANTTHISVVDSNGLTVSMTNTIMYFWGSGQLVDGYFMNNHLSRFEAIDTPANQPEPGRRTVTWSNPTMVLDSDARPVLAIGSPGGHQILNILSTVLIQWGLQGRSLEDAAQTLRFRAQENVLFLEEGHSSDIVTELENAGWDTQVWPDDWSSFGSIQPLEINYEDGTVTSVDDPRREGAHAIID